MVKKSEIRDIIRGLVDLYGTKDIVKLIGLLKIKIIYKYLPENKKARSMRNEFGDEFIYISPDVSENELNFILAHELGHLMLHESISCHYYNETFTNRDRLEFEANYFALELLMPSDIDLYEIEGLTAEQLSSMYGIPFYFILYKIDELKKNLHTYRC